jgi:hypothetical protein
MASINNLQGWQPTKCKVKSTVEPAWTKPDEWADDQTPANKSLSQFCRFEKLSWIMGAPREEPKDPLAKKHKNDGGESGAIDRIEQEETTRLDDADNFIKHTFEISNMLKHINAYNNINTLVSDWDRLTVANTIVYIYFLLLGMDLSGLDRRRGGVNTDNVSSTLLHRLSHKTATAAEIEYNLARPGANNLIEKQQAGWH